MALKKNEILKEIKKGRVKIEPYNQEMVKDASIELTLGSPLGIFGELKDFKGEPIIIDPDQPPSCVVQPLPFEKTKYELAPNERVVGKTLEKITLSPDICGWITPRARMSIYELNLSISSGFVQPGISDQNLFFLITNVGRVKVILRPGIKLVQLILMRL
jgi:dCTP deaminase